MDLSEVDHALEEQLSQPDVDLSEFANRKSRMVPVEGSFVVFTLDPLATIETLNDPIADKEACSIEKKTYVGCMREMLDVPLISRRYHRCVCYIVSHGPTPPLNGFDELMCVAIAPATHAGGRPPVEPSPPLPWNDLYIHVTSHFTVRIKTSGWLDHENSPMLNLGDFMDLSEYVCADALRAIWMDDSESEESRPPCPPPSLTSHASVLPARNHTADAEGSPITSSSGSACGSIGSFGDLSAYPDLQMAFMAGEHPENQFMPVVSFDLDISTAKEVANAHDLHDDIEAIGKIIARSQERRLESLDLLADGRMSAEILPPSAPLIKDVDGSGKLKYRKWERRMSLPLPLPPVYLDDVESVGQKSSGNQITAVPLSTNSKPWMPSKLRSFFTGLFTVVACGRSTDDSDDRPSQVPSTKFSMWPVPTSPSSLCLMDIFSMKYRFLYPNILLSRALVPRSFIQKAAMPLAHKGS
ncbi:hypothetical protein FA95DRAFT_1281864 [Auriscalpium vulgare]|uniref:Uncharacterized protein n=1 Tax=Auriscalpium vulgare TaxID=40419 RepID=A0ACB8RS80_9AGAM|nr:hypothetical protein FA95DRAFT_1281864 [Auriscalpium vulgare]